MVEVVGSNPTPCKRDGTSFDVPSLLLRLRLGFEKSGRLACQARGEKTLRWSVFSEAFLPDVQGGKTKPYTEKEQWDIF